jgi:hypothetical protein
MRIGNDLRDAILQSLAGKTGEELKDAIAYFHEIHGVSQRHLYRLSRSVRPAARKIRKDTGALKVAVADEHVDRIEQLTITYGIHAARAIEIAEMNGMIPRDVLTAATYNRILRERGLSHRRRNTDVKPATRWEARSPNEIHQFDTTKLEHLHFDFETKRITYDPRANHKNSRGEKPRAVWLYLMLDDFSRCEFAYLYLDLNALNHLDFLCRAWGEKTNSAEFPFFGIPKHIYMDNGGGNQAIKFLAALAKLGVHRIPTEPSSSEPYAARKRGKVEGAFKFYNAWEREFRMNDSLTWDDAQEFLYQRVLERNRRDHATTHRAPFQRWLSVGKPLHMPDAQFYKLLTYDNWTRVVDRSLSFRLENGTYRLPERRPFINWIGERIQVYAEPGRRETVTAVLGKDEVEVARAQENNVRPAFHCPQEPRDRTSVEEARERAQSTGTNGPLRLWEADKAAAAYLPRKGEAFDDARIAEKMIETDTGERRPSLAAERYLGYVEAARELQNDEFLSRPMKAAEQAWLKGIFAGREKIAETELLAAVATARSIEDKAAEA